MTLILKKEQNVFNYQDKDLITDIFLNPVIIISFIIILLEKLSDLLATV